MDRGKSRPQKPKAPLEELDNHLGDPFSARAILSLALPALGALVIEPLLLAIDSMMVGHLGTTALAALSLASTVLGTIVGLFVFLAYATTASASRALGRGNTKEAVRFGVDAMWLAGGLGVAVCALLATLAPQITSAMGASGEVAELASTYLRAAAIGSVGMLVILAATGTLRGLLDMKTPLYVLAGGACLNVALNFLLIYKLNLGVAGAGWALSATQTTMALALILRVAHAGRASNVSPWPSRVGVLGTIGDGAPLLVRTVSLRLALLMTVFVATSAGTLALAGYQVVSTVWNFTAFMLDALAIAAQSLVGVALGRGEAGDCAQRAPLAHLIRRLTIWGGVGGGVLGLLVAAASPLLPRLFGPDVALQQVAQPALVVAAIGMPVAGVAFVLDGALIGGAQSRYLAKMSLVTLVAYLPALGGLWAWIRGAQGLTQSQQTTALGLLWATFAIWFMAWRALANWIRARSL